LFLTYTNGHVDISKCIGGIIVKTADHAHTICCFRKSFISQDRT
jgi:hypothetical protein